MLVYLRHVTLERIAFRMSLLFTAEQLRRNALPDCHGFKHEKTRVE